MDFLQLRDKQFLITGVANRKSVAFHIARVLQEAGAKLRLTVRSPERRASVQKLFPDVPIHLCDVGDDAQLARLHDEIASANAGPLAGFVHSVAFADYRDGIKPFHETSRAAFLQAVDISCYSLLGMAGALRDLFDPRASIVTISISTTRMASENYGFMAPAKAALDSSVAFLAKSLSQTSQIRCNAVCAGLLKTSASAGIPGYVDNYLYAEQMTLRKQAVQTEEVANVAAFLLSPRSSGINAQGIVVDAGMEVNYFDREMVQRAMRPEPKS